MRLVEIIITTPLREPGDSDLEEIDGRKEESGEERARTSTTLRHNARLFPRFNHRFPAEARRGGGEARNDGIDTI